MNLTRRTIRRFQSRCGPRGSCRREPCERDAGRWTWCPDRLTLHDDYGKALKRIRSLWWRSLTAFSEMRSVPVCHLRTASARTRALSLPGSSPHTLSIPSAHSRHATGENQTSLREWPPSRCARTDPDTTRPSTTAPCNTRSPVGREGEPGIGADRQRENVEAGAMIIRDSEALGRSQLVAGVKRRHVAPGTPLRVGIPFGRAP